MAEQTSSVRLRPWAIGRAAFAESFGSPISCFRQNWLLFPFLLAGEIITQGVLGGSFAYEGWQWRIDHRWILNAGVDSFIGTLLSIYLYRRFALGEPISRSTLLPPWRRFTRALLFDVVFRIAMVAMWPFFGIAVWPLAFAFEHQPTIGIMLGVVWVILLNFALCRTGPAYIMLALDQRGALGRSWAMTHGHVWRMTLAFPWGYVPPLCGTALVAVVTSFILDDPEGPIATTLSVCASSLILVPTYHALAAIGWAIYRQLAQPEEGA